MAFRIACLVVALIAVSNGFPHRYGDNHGNIGEGNDAQGGFPGQGGPGQGYLDDFATGQDGFEPGQKKFGPRPLSPAFEPGLLGPGGKGMDDVPEDISDFDQDEIETEPKEPASGGFGPGQQGFGIKQSRTCRLESGSMSIGTRQPRSDRSIPSSSDLPSGFSQTGLEAFGPSQPGSKRFGVDGIVERFG